ncbi:MAG: major facilitator superfamily 1 [Ramlibacter sp.]|jgi:MFS family permease|uniref:MFS transporter n=1 Tax=Ramlibacter sp. TaxID=1917967 RepID=UPI00263363ED|nr:MFS transporter [Ramlibacter sp.]MDB5751234.1 major facilitator superfamily 1 [Ramlibacter sp.]
MKTQGGHDRRLVVWLSLAQLVTWGSVFYTFALLLEPVERELGLTRAQSSLAFSLALLAEGLLAYPVGRWIDRGHERAVMTGGSLLIACCLLLHSQVRSVEGFYAAWTLLGAGLAATLYTPVFAVVTRRFPDDFRRAIITLTFLGGLASSVFIPLTAWLIAEWGWRTALLLLAALHLVLCVPLHALCLRNAPPPTPARTPGGQSPATLLRSAPFLLITVFVIGMMAVTAAVPPHLISLLREGGLREAWVIAIPASIGVIQVAGRLLLYFFEHRFDLHLANRLIPFLIPLALAALVVAAAHPAAGVVFVLLYGLGNGMLTIVKGTAIAQYVSREHVASLNGALGMPTAVARAVAPLLLGLLWTREAGYRWGLVLLVVVALASAVALIMAQRRSLLPR